MAHTNEVGPRPRRDRSRRGTWLIGGGLLIAAAALLPWLRAEFDPPALRDADRAYREGRFEPALRLARDHLRRRPSSRAAARLAALCLWRTNRQEDAESYQHQAGPLSAEDLHVRAMSYVLANRREDAIRAFDDILNRDPDNLLAMQRKAAVFISQARWWDIEVLAGRIRQHPNGRVIGLTLEGLAHLRQANFESSVTAFQEVLRLDPQLREMPLKPQSEFWAPFAEALLNLGRAGDVRRYLEQPLTREENAKLSGLMARACQQQGDLDEAERWLRLTAQWDPHLSGPWLELGRQALLRHQPGEAVDLLKRAAALSPGATDPVYSLSQAYRQLGQIEEAERMETKFRDLKKARTHAPASTGPSLLAPRS